MGAISLNETTPISRGDGSQSSVRPETAYPVIPTAFALIVYALLIALTRTLDQGDTGIYAGDIVKRLHGPTPEIWEFGHAIWRPLGYLLLRIVSPATARAPEAVAYARATLTLTALSLVGGAVGLVSLIAWLRRIGLPSTIVALTAAGFSCAAAFLGYAQTGSAYIPALGMLLLGSAGIAASDDDPNGMAMYWASVSFAAAVLFWFPMVLGVPAAAISMIVLRGNNPRRLRVAIAACLISGSITIVVYAIVAALAGVRSIAGFKAWMSHASNGIAGIGGLPRAVIGFARSILNMDRLGLVTKRHLIHDPYNPTSWHDILSAGLLRLAAFYVLFGVVAIVLMRKPMGRRALALLLVAAIPVVGFALFWQGGDLERYLALFPAVFFALAVALTSTPEPARVVVAGVGVVVLAAANVPAISRGKSTRECAVLSGRLASIPQSAHASPMIITPHAMDEIATFRSRCPNAPILANVSAPQVYGLVMPNTATAPTWRDTLAARAVRTWASGGTVWISRRAFRPTPAADWKWAEGDEPTVRWRDFPAYFDSVDVGPPVGGDDGFVELLQTPRTLQKLQPPQHQ